MSGAGPFGSLPSDTEEWDDFLFTDDEALYSQLVDDTTTNATTGNDDWDNNIWYGFDTEGFPNYLPTSRDPGYWMFVFVAIYSVILMVGLPIMVVLGRRWEARRDEAAELAVKAMGGDNGNDGGDDNNNGGEEDDFVDEPTKMEQGRSGKSAAVPQAAISNQKQQLQRQPTPAVGGTDPQPDRRSQVSSTTFQHPPANTTAVDQSQSHEFSADFSNLHNVTNMTNMTATSANLLPARPTPCSPPTFPTFTTTLII